MSVYGSHIICIMMKPHFKGIAASIKPRVHKREGEYLTAVCSRVTPLGK